MDEDVLAAMEAEAAGLLDALGIVPLADQDRCATCRRERPSGRPTYCSDRCSQTARQARWRAKHPG